MNIKTENNETLEKLIELFNEVFEGEVDLSGFSTESNLIDDLGMNSIGLLYMAMAVEEEFGLRFNNDDFKTLQTVGDVIAKIEGK